MYNLFGGWEAANAVLHHNIHSNETILSGTFRNFFVSDTTQYRHTFIWSIDSLGNENIKTLYASPPNNLIGFYPLHTDYSIILKYEEQKTNAFDNKLFYMSTIGDTIASYQVEYPPKFNSLTYTLHPSNKFIYSTGKDITLSSSTTAPFAILCIDTTGKQLWYKTYPGKRRYANSVVIDDDGNFIVAGSSYKGDGGAFDTTSGWYAKLGTAGNFIWERFLDKDSITKAYYTQVFKHQNTYMLFSGNDASRPNQLDTNESFVSNYTINHYNGDLIKYRRFLYNEQKLGVWVDMHISSNSGMYGIGGFETKEGQFNYTQYLMFLKLDNDGNVKWQRFFKQWYKDNRAFSLTAVPDGFIICADGKDTTHTTGITDAWIIKTDTNGCIVPGCHLTDGLVQITNPDAFIKVFPNPASDNVTVQITDERAKLKSYFIYDTQGNFILQQAIHHTPETFSINTQQLPNGNYYLVLEFAGGERAVKKLMIQR